MSIDMSGQANITVKSHTMSKMYLWKFTEKGELRWYDLITHEHDSTGVKGVSFICHYYEVPGLPINTVEKRLSSLEKAGNAALDKIIKGTADDCDRETVKSYLSVFRVRSPMYRCLMKDICRTELGIWNRFQVENEVRRRLNELLDSCDHQLFDMPIDEFDVTSVKWPGTALMTSDNPVFGYDLRRILRNPSGSKLPVILFPLDPCNLLIVFRRSDAAKIQELVENHPENVDPILVRKAIMENAVARLYYLNEEQLKHDRSLEFDRHEVNDEAYLSLAEDEEFAEEYWERIRDSVPTDVQGSDDECRDGSV